MHPHRKLRTPSSLSRPAQYGVSVAVIVLIPVLVLAAGEEVRAALDFTGGVLTLLSLSGAVVWGLIATDRNLFEPRERLLAQAIHRTLAVASLGFLLLHITTKISSGHVGLLGTLVPFGLGMQGSAGLIGLGSLAAHLMIFAGATGALRSAMATPGAVAARWRALHAMAYPAWGAALVHGLNAGRPAAGWVVAMYAMVVVAVALAVSVRLLPPPQKRRVARLLISITRPEEGTRAPRRRAEASSPSERDPSVAPLPGSGPLPGGISRAPRIDEPPLRLDSARPAPISAGRGADISAAYRAVSAAPQPSTAFGQATGRPVPGSDPLMETLSPVSPMYPMSAYADPTQTMPTVSATDPTEILPPVPPYPAPTETLPPVPSYAAPPSPASGRWPAPSPPPPGETRRARPETDPRSGTPYPPSPGEPWHQPAGDRP
ncbi:hypothetical protein [Streptomyces sp. KR80]|uniref:hypothetical protein n=1 Tax=Streptomyces sp. KR80 TaxID=3457426 RepID=UPI003FD6443F